MKQIILYIVISVLICICVLRSFVFKGTEEHIITTTDTIFVDRTLIDTVPVIRYKKVVRHEIDTLYSVDSIKVPIFVPISQTLYSKTIQTDSDTISYRAYVSGYKTLLDSIRFDLRYQRYTNNTTIIQPRKHFYFSHGIQAGIGYGIFNRKPDLYIGYGVSFNF